VFLACINGDIMEYKILENSSAAKLENEVNMLIGKGWKPAGGVACSAEGPYGEPCLFQSMIRSSAK
jgi:hypothetical protein